MTLKIRSAARCCQQCRFENVELLNPIYRRINLQNYNFSLTGVAVI